MSCGECELSLKIKIVTKKNLPSELIRETCQQIIALYFKFGERGGRLRQLCELIYFRHIKKIKVSITFLCYSNTSNYIARA